ncbi:hypothetical protein BCF44_12241 [Kutzneria buriramensis]|uniref:Uncharacterized protein n=1 Tax=Kutzneria buriramensis TaxID=1045776 RepID=A0A3E0GVX6_9PSEU|nr:hypothetical protein BCF44_12241 [Kutzneria buriramensis]
METNEPRAGETADLATTGLVAGLSPLPAGDCWLANPQVAALAGKSVRWLAVQRGRPQRATPPQAYHLSPKYQFFKLSEVREWLQALGIRVDLAALRQAYTSTTSGDQVD